MSAPLVHEEAARSPAVQASLPTTGRLIVLIPAYNEAAKVGEVVRDVNRHLPAADVLVIDDGSKDDTARAARAAGALTVVLPMNVGYGAALQTGYKYALRGGYDLVAQLDADGQHEAVYLLKLLDELRDPDVDVVIGSRFLDGDGHYRPSRARQIGMALFAWLGSRFTRQRISDPTSGFQVLRIGVARFFCSEVYPADYPDVDILITLHRSGFRVREVGVRMQMPTGQSMHSGHRSIYYIYKMMLSVLVTLLRPRARS